MNHEFRPEAEAVPEVPQELEKPKKRPGAVRRLTNKLVAGMAMATALGGAGAADAAHAKGTHASHGEEDMKDKKAREEREEKDEEAVKKQRKEEREAREKRQKEEIKEAEKDRKVKEEDAKDSLDEAEHMEDLAKIRSKSELKLLVAEGRESFNEALASAARVEIRSSDARAGGFMDKVIAGRVANGSKSDERTLVIKIETVNTPGSYRSEEAFQVQVFASWDDAPYFVHGTGSRQRAHMLSERDTPDDTLIKRALNDALEGLIFTGPR